VVIGALTTYTDIRRSGVCREHLPALVEAAATIGAAQIQNRGTIGGNIANASPAGDTLPVLLALDAAIVVGGPQGERTVAADDFWVAYRRTALAPDELILRVRIPLAGGRETRFRKVGTRRAQAISKVVMALSWRERARPGAESTWSDVRLALGSVADRPIRARATEAVLTGAPPTPETADGAAESLVAEIVPIDDVRSTADYRRAVAARVLHRMIRDAGGW
jgi:CO/xanthine dehydrogenase FAD-binding subunit